MVLAFLNRKIIGTKAYYIDFFISALGIGIPKYFSRRGYRQNFGIIAVDWPKVDWPKISWNVSLNSFEEFYTSLFPADIETIRWIRSFEEEGYNKIVWEVTLGEGSSIKVREIDVLAVSDKEVITLAKISESKLFSSISASSFSKSGLSKLFQFVRRNPSDYQRLLSMLTSYFTLSTLTLLSMVVNSYFRHLVGLAKEKTLDNVLPYPVTQPKLYEVDSYLTLYFIDSHIKNYPLLGTNFEDIISFYSDVVGYYAVHMRERSILYRLLLSIKEHFYPNKSLNDLSILFLSYLSNSPVNGKVVLGRTALLHHLFYSFYDKIINPALFGDRALDIEEARRRLGHFIEFNAVYVSKKVIDYYAKGRIAWYFFAQMLALASLIHSISINPEEKDNKELFDLALFNEKGKLR